jgi:hypothetical protein
MNLAVNRVLGRRDAASDFGRTADYAAGPMATTERGGHSGVLNTNKERDDGFERVDEG